MNAITKEEGAVLDARVLGLAKLREPVPEHLISPLPKGTKAQNECEAKDKINCDVCGGWHHPRIRHLAYVGHAAATHLLLDADLEWNWEPLAYTEDGLPRFDASGGLWIKLTVCGVTRLGYGHADAKKTADAGAREKEVIGDALRNAAMRFGLALELWTKADIHHRDEEEDRNPHPPEQSQEPTTSRAAIVAAVAKAVETFPQAEFDKNLQKWLDVIESGRKTVDELISFVEAKGRKLTDAQKARIRER